MHFSALPTDSVDCGDCCRAIVLYFIVCHWKFSVGEKFSDWEQKFVCTIAFNTKPERCYKLIFFFAFL